VTFDALASGSSWRLQVKGKESLVPIRPRLTVSTAEAAVDAAVAGLGITCVLSYQVEAAIRGKNLALVLEAFEPAAIPVSLIYSSQGRLPLKLRALLDFAAPRLRVQLHKTAAALKGAQRQATASRKRSGGR
jgi:DNA-binding transcriptional LysR family regulator